MAKDINLDDFMVDSRGALIPRTSVREIDIKRDELVKELIEGAKCIAGELASFKADARDSIQGFVKESFKELRVKMGGKKGNVTLMSFDGQYKVIYANADLLVFDERLQVAKELIDRCIRDWSAGANDKLMAVINKAFQVDAEGNVNAKRVLELKTLRIDDANWRKAMEAIAQATNVVASKNYVRFYERLNGGQYRQISLNIASD